MNALAILKHFRILNGRHWVILCNPSILANESNSVAHRTQLTCPTCFTALNEDETNTIKREVFKRMNGIGRPQK